MGVKFFQKFTAILEMAGRQAIQQLQRRNIHFTDIRTVHKKRIVHLAPVAAAIAFDRADDVAGESAADSQEGGQTRSGPAFCHNRPEVWLDACRIIEGAGERYSPRFSMSAVKIAVGANEGKAIAPRR